MLTLTQRAILATRLSDRGERYIWLHGGQITSATSMKARGLIASDASVYALELHHITPLAQDLFFAGDSAFIAESLSGELLLFENRKFVIGFSNRENEKIQRMLKAYLALHAKEDEEMVLEIPTYANPLQSKSDHLPPMGTESGGAVMGESVKIEKGKFYRTRDGRKIGPAIPEIGRPGYPWDVGPNAYTGGGHYWANGHKSPADIVAEWPIADSTPSPTGD